MNIRKQLLVRHSRENADIVIAHVVNTPGAIIELMACFFSDEVKVAQRASQVVGDIGRQQPDSLEPWWDEMVCAAEDPIHDAIRRSVARYFSELELKLPPKTEQSLVQLFTDWACDRTTPIAIQVYAMQFVADRADDFPAEAKRITAQIRAGLNTASPGLRSRGTRILEQLEP